jgi:hypothetical protein
MYNPGTTSGILQNFEGLGQEAGRGYALSPISGNRTRYKQSKVCNHISDRLWKKFDNIRLAPLSPIRVKVRQKNIDIGSHGWLSKSDGL